MDDMRQHISLSRRLTGIAKPRLCNMAAERYRQIKRPRGSNEPRGRFCVSKNLRGKLFYPKTSQFSCHCEAAARPWQSESRRHGIPWRSMGARSKREALSQKHGIRRFISLSLSLFQGSVSFRATIVRYGMTSRFVKDCRVGRTRPPRNDRIDRLDRKYGTQNPIFGIRKTFLIC